MNINLVVAFRDSRADTNASKAIISCSLQTPLHVLGNLFQLLCSCACNCVLTNRLCPPNQMVAGSSELLSGLYSNPGKESEKWKGLGQSSK